MSKTLNFGINIDATQIIQTIVNTTQKSSYNDRYIDNNQGRWISCQAGGFLISACYHSTQQHSATVIGRAQCKSIAPPGQWAVAYTNNRMLGGNKTFYYFGPHLK